MWDRHTPVDETMRALDDEVRAGRIGYLGISDTPAWVIARANTITEWRGWTAFAGLQAPYNLLQRDIERELLPMAEGFGMTVASWSPLEGGILTGKFLAPDGPEPGTRISQDAITGRQRYVAAMVSEIADELGATPSQVAIAWIRARSPAIHPIIGTRRLDQLLDNLGTADVKLPDEHMTRLNAATAPDLGFPATFIRETSPWVFGAADLDGD